MSDIDILLFAVATFPLLWSLFFSCVFNSILSLYPLHASSFSFPNPNIKKCLQILPKVPLATKLNYLRPIILRHIACLQGSYSDYQN